MGPWLPGNGIQNVCRRVLSTTARVAFLQFTSWKPFTAQSAGWKSYELQVNITVVHRKYRVICGHVAQVVEIVMA